MTRGIVLIAIVAACVAWAPSVNAQQPLPGAQQGGGGQGPLVPCGVGQDAQPCTLRQLFVLGGNVFRFLLSLGAIAAVAAIVVAGYQYIMSRGDPSALAAAKQKLLLAIIGLLFLLFTVVIINTILRTLKAKYELEQIEFFADDVP